MFFVLNKSIFHQIVEVFSTLVNPEISISPFITSLTGISDEMVKNAPKEGEAVKSFLDFSKGFVLAGHNIKRFDFGFIDRVAREKLKISVDNDFIDSLTLAKVFLPELPSRSLGNLATYYGVKYIGAHRAENDCRINFEVLEMLFKEKDNPTHEARICPNCGKAMVKRNGRYGEFWGCSGFPICRSTSDI